MFSCSVKMHLNPGKLRGQNKKSDDCIEALMQDSWESWISTPHEKCTLPRTQATSEF